MKKNLSIWEREVTWPKCDIAILGSGIVGVTTAIFLKRLHPSLSVAVFERGAHPIGASVKNAGFVCFGSPTEILADLKTMGRDDVQSLIRQRYLGLHALFSLVSKDDMDYQQTGSYEVILPGEEGASFEQLKDNLGDINQLVEDSTGLRDVYSKEQEAQGKMGLYGEVYGIKNRWEGTLHSGKMMGALVRKALQSGVQFFWEHEMVQLDSRSNHVRLYFKDRRPFYTKKILLANNSGAHKWVEHLDVYPVRNQVMVTAPVPALRLRGAYHMHEGYVYFRNIGQRVLIGGGRHIDFEGSKTDVQGDIPAITSYLTEILSRVIAGGPTIPIEYAWSGILGVGAKKTPIIRMVTDQIGVAVRLGGMGVALGTLVGKKAAQMLLNTHDE